MSTYDIGSVSRLIGIFTALDGTLTNPDEVTLYVKDPLGNVTEYTGGQLVNDSAGVYHYDLTLSVVGIYYYRYEGAGNLIAAGDSQLQVTSSPFYPGCAC